MAERHLESGPSDWKSLIPPSDKGIALETYEECHSLPLQTGTPLSSIRRLRYSKYQNYPPLEASQTVFC